MQQPDSCVHRCHSVLGQNVANFQEAYCVMIGTADEWVRGTHDVPHAQEDTTGACEGFHSDIKGNELGQKSRLQGRGVDWLLYPRYTAGWAQRTTS